jgi:transposase
MRGTDQDQSTMFSYVSPEARIPADHPLRATREMTNRALARMDRQFRKLYSRTGRPSVAPEQLLRALLLQVLYSIRSERMLMEQLEYNLLFRWFVGLEMDDRVWDVTVFTKNRNRLLEGEIAESFFQAVLEQAREAGLLSDEHFTVDGTLIEAWAGQKSFRPKDEDGGGSSSGGARPNGRDAACGSEQPQSPQRDRRPDDDSCGLRDQPTKAQASRASVWLGEDDRPDSQGEAPRSPARGLDVHLHSSRLQPGEDEAAAMSDVTLRDRWTVRDRPPQQRSPSRGAVQPRFEGETSSEPQILAPQLRFSAAC